MEVEADKVQARESERYEMYNVAEDWGVCKETSDSYCGT